MYFAKFDTANGEWIQATATVQVAATRDDHRTRGWDELGHSLTRALNLLPRGTIARRLSIDEQRQLHQSVSIAAPAEFESNAREMMADLTRLESILGGSVAIPTNREQHDLWYATAPPLRYSFESDSFSVAGVPVVCNFRIKPLLDELFVDAALSGYTVAYQLHVHATTISSHVLASARKTALMLKRLPGATPSLLAWQQRLARELAGARAIIQECVMVATPAAGRRIAAILREHFNAGFRQYGFETPDFEFERDGHEEAVSVGVHVHELDAMSPTGLCGAALVQEHETILLWSPSARLLPLLTTQSGVASSDSDVDNVTDAALHGAPHPYDGTDPFAFVSYKRSDFESIVPVLRLAQKVGLRLWYDRGIPGGSEWDAIIEDRLKRCTFVLLFLSNAAVASKYVRREVKFADALNIPVLSVLIEDTRLSHGLQMLLTQFQMLDRRSLDFETRLRVALNELGCKGRTP